MIKWIINDFKSVRGALSYMRGKDIPMWIAVLYYIIVGALALPFAPFVYVWYKIQMKKIRSMEEA